MTRSSRRRRNSELRLGLRTFVHIYGSSRVGIAVMDAFPRIVASLAVGLTLASIVATTAVAQPPSFPDAALQGRIPAPLPPPPQPPIINGPLGQSPPPGVYVPPRLTTHSDRVTSCLQEGAGYGLKGSKLNAYARSCANAN